MFHIFLFGPRGVGKSTLVRILLREKDIEKYIPSEIFHSATYVFLKDFSGERYTCNIYALPGDPDLAEKSIQKMKSLIPEIDRSYFVLMLDPEGGKRWSYKVAQEFVSRFFKDSDKIVILFNKYDLITDDLPDEEEYIDRLPEHVKKVKKIVEEYLGKDFFEKREVYIFPISLVKMDRELIKRILGQCLDILAPKDFGLELL